MAEDNKKTKSVSCPDCKALIVIPETVQVGDILECGECGSEIEIISIDPIKYRELIETK